MYPFNVAGRNPLEVLRDLGGYYEVPKNAAGERLGPLVGYAGRDREGRQYVGEVYANFAKAEEWPDVLDFWAGQLSRDLYESVDVCCGMPMGGILFSASLARACQSRSVYLEKKVFTLATDYSREKSKLVFGRHDLEKGDRVAIVEDVTNNFSTTAEAIRLIQSQGAKVVVIVCLLNRSRITLYEDNDAKVPVMALVHHPFPEYTQDDPAVVADIQAGNVVWKPKAEWAKLVLYRPQIA